MQFTPEFDQAKLIKRYKRFLADVTLADGSTVTIHCPNTGSMRNCLFPEQTVYFSVSDNPKRKYSRTWELTETPAGHLIGINTGRANALAEEAIKDGTITELQGYKNLKREVKYGSENSRIDILLSEPDDDASSKASQVYIEVKSCTLLEDDRGYFPDAVTTRGQKHLRELMEMVEQGHRGVLLFVVQHTGINIVQAAEHIDPQYAELLKQAAQSGVEVLAYCAQMSAKSTRLIKSCPVNL
ncbi:DNA/RNA nuclease SfsA [Shewanella waksmanii]|uniref:DNA/RNA nuclease SfsA n=1 Tax=Shewanella waksmanii TaxID=213783 RepID=UPI00049112F8|nr:DNA/RNA nuclease SfsA [Shewanella waksmanii]